MNEAYTQILQILIAAGIPEAEAKQMIRFATDYMYMSKREFVCATTLVGLAVANPSLSAAQVNDKVLEYADTLLQRIESSTANLGTQPV